MNLESQEVLCSGCLPKPLSLVALLLRKDEIRSLEMKSMAVSPVPHYDLIASNKLITPLQRCFVLWMVNSFCSLNAVVTTEYSVVVLKKHSSCVFSL